MISCNRGELILKGDLSDLSADYSTITMKLIETVSKSLGDEAAREYVKHAYEQGCLTREEVSKKVLEKLNSEDFMGLLDKLMEEVFGKEGK